MKRFIATELDKWFKSPDRKPLVLRGARQVGKTWLVRNFAERHQLDLIELNLEKQPGLSDLFSENNPGEILRNIEAALAVKIDPFSACLFLDEIQATPELFSKLRWFREDMPELAVIAAGSLLEFALKDLQYSMPVGRITYFYLEPMTFFEFVLASENEALYQYLVSFNLKKTLPPTLHKKCLKLYKEYCVVGGMPEVVQNWVDSGDVNACIKLQYDLIATYRDDFHKYGDNTDAKLIHKLLLSVAERLGNKFVYSKVDRHAPLIKVKKILMMLSLAKVCSRVLHTSGNGIPLGAQSNEKFFKALMVDIGLISVQLGLSAVKGSELDKMALLNKGGLAEQFVGQQLRAAQSPFTDTELFYWQRTGGRVGEVDYIIQYGNRIVPVEVKSGAAGSMKSLHQFMAEKNLDFAVRFNANLPALESIHVKTTLGAPVAYRLLTVPLYLAENLDSIIEQTMSND